MNGLLRIEIDWADGTLPRLVGLIERRGFQIADVELVDMGLVRQLSATIRPRDDAKSFDTLCRQIDRLHGVTRHGAPEGSAYANHRFPLVG